VTGASGQLSAILTRAALSALLMGLLLVPVLSSAQTLERIQRTGTFNIGFIPDQAPFSIKAADGRAEGYSIGLCRKVADSVKAALGLTSLDVKYIATPMEPGFGMVAGGEVDILCGAVTATLKRRARVSFSLPVYSGGIGVLLRRDAHPSLVNVLEGDARRASPRMGTTMNRGLVNHIYAVHAGTTSEQWVRKKVYTLGIISRIVTVDTHEKGVDLVARKKADAYFADRIILENYAARSQGHEDLMVLDRYFSHEPIALVTARGDEDFRLLVDTTLSDLYHSGAISDIYTRYFGKPDEMTDLLFEIYARP